MYMPAHRTLPHKHLLLATEFPNVFLIRQSHSPSTPPAAILESAVWGKGKTKGLGYTVYRHSSFSTANPQTFAPIFLQTSDQPFPYAVVPKPYQNIILNILQVILVILYSLTSLLTFPSFLHQYSPDHF